MADQDVKIKLSAVDQASGVFERTAAALKNMKRESRMAGENALEQALGSGQGATNAIADYLGIGLQSIIVDKIGGAFAAATDKMVEMQKALAEGRATIGDMVTEMAKGLPILGGFVAGFLNIRELITGEKAEIDEINAAMDRNVKLSGARLAVEIKMQELHKASRETLRDMNDQMAMNGMVDPELSRYRFLIQRQKAVAAAEDKYGNPTEEEKTLGPQLRAASATRQQLENRLAELREMKRKYDDFGKDPSIQGLRINLSAGEREELQGSSRKIQDAKAEEDSIRRQLNDATNSRLTEKQRIIDKAMAVEREQRKRFNKETGLMEAEDARKAQFEVASIESETRQISMRAQHREMEASLDALRTQRQRELSDSHAEAEAQRRKESDPTERLRMHDQEWSKHAAIVAKYQAQIDETIKQGYKKQLDNEAAVQDLLIKYPGSPMQGPLPAKNSGLANAYNTPTVTPDLIMGNGSGLAARQREESAARDDKMQKQLMQLEKIGTTLVDIRVLLNPAAGPPVLGGF